MNELRRLILFDLQAVTRRVFGTWLDADVEIRDFEFRISCERLFRVFWASDGRR